MSASSHIKQVLHIVPALFGSNGGIVGGAERYALELARHMANVVPTKLVTFGNQENEKIIGNLAIRVIGNSWYVRGQRTNPLSISLISELKKASIIHCHQQHVLASSVSALFCRLTGRKVFVSDLGGGGWDISGYISTDSWYHGHLHISEYSKKTFNHTNNPKAHVILGGVDTDKFSPSTITTRTNTILFVGRVLPHKGINYLVEALPKNMKLEIIGSQYDSQFASDLKLLAKDIEVTFHDNCDDLELISAYRKACCLVLPSVYKTMYGQETNVPELLGQTLLEAMACGLPVICTNVASMPEIVEDGITGFIVPPNDSKAINEKICWLQNNPEKAVEMGNAARKKILEKFNWKNTVTKCLKIYTS